VKSWVDWSRVGNRLPCRKQINTEHCDAVPFEEDWEPRYKTAPTQPVPVIRQHPNEPGDIFHPARDISSSPA
jgi:hypothetical protein